MVTQDAHPQPAAVSPCRLPVILALALLLIVSHGAIAWAQSPPCNDYGLLDPVIGSLAFNGSQGGVVVIDQVRDIAYVAPFGYLHVVDISDPAAPSLLSTVVTGTTTYGMTLGPGHVYLTVFSGLQILDVSVPAAPVMVKTLPLSGLRGVAYVSNRVLAGGSTGLNIVNVSTPSTPFVESLLDLSEQIFSVLVSNGFVYLGGASSFYVVDWSPTVQPSVIGSVPVGLPLFELDTEATNLVYGVTAESFYAFDVQDPTQPSPPVIAGQFVTPGDASAVDVQGARAYVSDRSGGLTVVDIGDPASLDLAGGWFGDGSTMALALGPGSTVWALDFTGLLVALDPLELDNFAGLGELATPGQGLDIDAEGDRVFVADGPAGVQVYDVSDMATPAFVGEVSGFSTAFDLDVQGDFAYVAGGSSGLVVVDVTNPALPLARGATSTGACLVVHVDGSYAYCLLDGLIRAVDVSDPDLPVPLAGIPDLGATSGGTLGMDTEGPYLYMAASAAGLVIADRSDPAALVQMGSVDTPGIAEDVVVRGSYAYVADRSSVQIVDVSDPANPALVANANTAARVNSVRFSGDLLYLCGEFGSMSIVSVADPLNPVVLPAVRTHGNPEGIAVAAGGLVVVSENVGLETFPLQCMVTAAPERPTFVGATIRGVYPNPFNPRTTIEVDVFSAQAVQLEIIDVRGRRVRSLLSGTLSTGRHEVAWDGTDSAGRKVASGAYRLVLRGREGVESQILTLLK